MHLKHRKTRKTCPG